MQGQILYLTDEYITKNSKHSHLSNFTRNFTRNFTNFTAKMAHNQNPGNFSNRPQEEVENIARMGGQSSHRSGFASMDTDKQVLIF